MGFRCCPLRSFPCTLVIQCLPPWGVVVQGNSGGIPFFARCPLGHILIVSCCVPFSCVGGGGEKKNYYLLLLCTAVTLTIDWIYNFTVTVGRMLTCVLDGFTDLFMLAWAFRAVFFILLMFSCIPPPYCLQVTYNRGGRGCPQSGRFPSSPCLLFSQLTSENLGMLLLYASFMPARSTSTVSAFIVRTPTYTHLSRSLIGLLYASGCTMRTIDIIDSTRLVFCNTYYLYCSHRVGRVGLGWTGVRPSQSGTPLLQAKVAYLYTLYIPLLFTSGLP